MDGGVGEGAALFPLLEGAEIEMEAGGKLSLREAQFTAERARGRGGEPDSAGGQGDFASSVGGGFAGGGDEPAGEGRIAAMLS